VQGEIIKAKSGAVGGRRDTHFIFSRLLLGSIEKTKVKDSGVKFPQILDDDLNSILIHRELLDALHFDTSDHYAALFLGWLEV
jgi:hypothetical protein